MKYCIAKRQSNEALPTGSLSVLFSPLLTEHLKAPQLRGFFSSAQSKAKSHKRGMSTWLTRYIASISFQLMI